MHRPTGIVEIFLQPGEWYFGDRYTRIRTVLGSCVSVVFWHPEESVGGMCHYVLPTRGKVTRAAALDGRYGDEAFGLLLKEIRGTGLCTGDFRVRLFGGGDMFPEVRSQAAGTLIGQQNVAAARRLIQEHCLQCIGAHVEGVGHRHLLFDVWSGRVTMKRGLVPEK
jgi:chemotaxis protein CheD